MGVLVMFQQSRFLHPRSSLMYLHIPVTMVISTVVGVSIVLFSVSCVPAETLSQLHSLFKHNSVVFITAPALISRLSSSFVNATESDTFVSPCVAALFCITITITITCVTGRPSGRPLVTNSKAFRYFGHDLTIHQTIYHAKCLSSLLVPIEVVICIKCAK